MVGCGDGNGGGEGIHTLFVRVNVMNWRADMQIAVFEAEITELL